MAVKMQSLTRPIAKNFATEVIRRSRSNTGTVFLQPKLEFSFNVQINAELFAGYTYLAMANYFGRQSVALPGCKTFYMEQVKEEERHARKLMDFIIQRGGRVFLQPLNEPIRQEWDSPLTAFRQALELEVDITQKLLNLHEECQGCSDLFGCNLLESYFLDEQVESVDTVSRYIAQIERMGCDGLAIQLFDQYLLDQCNRS